LYLVVPVVICPLAPRKGSVMATPCFDDPGSILQQSLCLSALSKDLKGSFGAPHATPHECHAPACKTLKVVQTLKLAPDGGSKQLLYQSGLALPPGRFSAKVVVRENRTGAVGEVPRPAETCRRIWAPQREAPRARERSRPQLVTIAP